MQMSTQEKQRNQRAAASMRYAEISAPIALIISFLEKQARSQVNEHDPRSMNEQREEIIENMWADLTENTKAQIRRRSILVSWH